MLLTRAPLYQVALALSTTAGTTLSGFRSVAGYWLDIALVAEAEAGAATTANSNIIGYMTRAAVALESIAGTSGAEENQNYQGLLKRIVDALEAQTGVGTGSLLGRLVVAAQAWTGGNYVVVNPAITGTPVVGETLTASSGTYDATPTSYSYQWKRGGADISGATSMFYTLVDTDAASATRGNITCQVTANFASGSPVTTTTAPTTMPRRTYPTLAIRTGRLTNANYGGVSYNHPNLKCLGVGASDGTWSRGAATSGTDGHWVAHATNPTITPIPSGNSVTVDPTYVFPVTFTHADGLVENITLTVTTVANTQTVSHREMFGSGTQLAMAHINTAGAGGFVEFATGVDWTSKRIQFQSIRMASMTTFRDADFDRRALPTEYDFLGTDNCTFDDLQVDTALGASPSNSAFFMSDQGTTKTGTLVVNRPKVRGSRAALDAGTDGTRIAFDGFRINASCVSLTVNDADFQWVHSGFSQSPSSDSLGTVTATINNARIRYFTNNAFIVGGDSTTNKTTLTLNDTVVMSPMRAGVVGVNISTVHCDTVQVSDTAANHEININRQIFVQADGEAYCQSGVFSDNSTARADRTLNVNGMLDATRAYYGVAIAATNSATVQGVTAWKTESGTVRSTTTSPDANDSHVPGGPFFYCRNTGPNSGTNTLQKCIFYDSINDLGAVWTKANNSAHGGTLTSPPTNTGFAVANPKAALDALVYEGRTIDAIVADVKAILTPAAGGGYDLGGGAWKGALKGDGSWNVP